MHNYFENILCFSIFARLDRGIKDKSQERSLRYENTTLGKLMDFYVFDLV